MSDTQKPSNVVAVQPAQVRTSADVIAEVKGLFGSNFHQDGDEKEIKSILERPQLSEFEGFYQNIWHHCNNGVFVLNCLRTEGLLNIALKACALPEKIDSDSQALYHPVSRDSNIPTRTALAYIARILEISRDEGKLTNEEFVTIMKPVSAASERLDKARVLMQELQQIYARGQGTGAAAAK